MCVFSPPLLPSLPCRFIPGPNGALPPQLCVPRSSPHLRFLLPPNRLKLLHPWLLTGLPETTERISTQIKGALLVWCQGFETRLIPFDQWAPCWWLSSTTLLRPVSDLFPLSFSVSLNWSLTEMTKHGQFKGSLKHYLIDIRILRTVSGGLRPHRRNSSALEWDFLAQTGCLADETFCINTEHSVPGTPIMLWWLKDTLESI